MATKKAATPAKKPAPKKEEYYAWSSDCSAGGRAEINSDIYTDYNEMMGDIDDYLDEDESTVYIFKAVKKIVSSRNIHTENL